jgi:hypothetical protein
MSTRAGTRLLVDNDVQVDVKMGLDDMHRGPALSNTFLATLANETWKTQPSSIGLVFNIITRE